MMFKDDFANIEKELKMKREERISYIIPRPFIKRIVWIILRKIFELLKFEKGINWLRSWRTEWMLIIDDRIFYFKNRDEAISFEREYIIESLKRR